MKSVTVSGNNTKQFQGQGRVQGSARNNKNQRESQAVGVTENIRLIVATLNTNTRWGKRQDRARRDRSVNIPQAYIDQSIHTEQLTGNTNTPTYGTVNIFMVGSVGDLFLANVTISWAGTRAWHLTIGAEEAPI